MGIVGPGFVGTHHLDAIRRLGFVEIVGLAASTYESARRHAETLGVRRPYPSYESLVADPDVHVVHVTTPNYLHAPVIREAIAHAKHVVCDKPLAVSAAEALELWRAAQTADIVHAVTFNYRGNPLVQQAREMVAAGEIGPVHYVQGAYLQDWLLKPTDYSWRLDPAQGGPSSAMGDIGSHWCDIVEHVVGSRIEAVLADLSTVVSRRWRPERPQATLSGSTSATTAGPAPEGGTDRLQAVDVGSEDLATVLLRFVNGAKGCVSIGQVCAGHKNDLWFEVSGRAGSLRWHQERQNELWVGRRDGPNAVLPKDPALLAPEARRYAHLPPGHQEGWSDAFCNVLRDVYSRIAAVITAAASTSHPSKSPSGSITTAPSAATSAAFATFEDGYRSALVVDAVLESHRRGGSWTRIGDGTSKLQT
jgi:predicted dehydrogenase